MNATAIPFSKPTDGGIGVAERDFRRVDESRYLLVLRGIGIEFEIDRLRRKWDQLVGELTVRCNLIGARPTPAGDINLSSIRDRQDWVKTLKHKSRASDVPWEELLDEFIQRVFDAERSGRPALLLRDLERPARDEAIDVDGFPLLRRHAVIVFGDGGAAKSYLGLYIAGRLEQRGIRTLYADWEFAGEDHRDRLERLFGDAMPEVRYIRCERPLVHEVDHLRRVVLDHRIDIAVLDSVAFAAHGKPEDAEVAAAFFRANRQLGIGTLNIAHITNAAAQSKDADVMRPFGSAFWHNGCRSSWFAKRASESADGRDVTVGLFHRKNNLGPQLQPLGFQFSFDSERTAVHRVNLADVPQLADSLPVAQRIRGLVRTGAMTYAVLADELGEKPNTIMQTVKRNKGKLFTIVIGEDGIQRVGLLTSVMTSVT